MVVLVRDLDNTYADSRWGAEVVDTGGVDLDAPKE